MLASDPSIGINVTGHTQRPHVMLLDIRMPGMSGMDVMKTYGKPTPFPVVAMTGNVDVDSVNAYRFVF